MLAASGMVSMLSAHAMQQGSAQSETAVTEALMARVGQPSAEAARVFIGSGMTNVRAHVLTVSELLMVKAVLSSLPALNRQVLEENLHSIAFVDGIPGDGTGLTSPFGTTKLYDITLRASILNESLSAFLTAKERKLFTEDGSAISVSVKGTGTDALNYVLLHESTHVMDKSCGITAQPGNRFTAGIWTSQNALVPQLSSSIAARTLFRRGRLFGFGRAAGLYDALAQTPFVSLYSTASASDDFAELVAWHEIEKQHHGDLVITVNDDRGRILRRWEPLTFNEVQKRFLDVDVLLASQRHCGFS